MTPEQAAILSNIAFEEYDRLTKEGFHAEAAIMSAVSRFFHIVADRTVLN